MEAKQNDSFMAPIWAITLMTMVGTAALMYAWHRFDLNREHKANMRQIALVDYRTKQYEEYYKVEIAQGKKAADAQFDIKHGK